LSGAGKGVALVLPWRNLHAMNRHLDEISQAVAPGTHAILIVDQAARHTSPKLDIPANITILPLPARSPELNPVENVWQFMRNTWLSNRIFRTSSISAAMPGTSSSTSPRASCPWSYDNGHMGFNKHYFGVQLALADQASIGAVWNADTPASAGDPTPGSWGGHCLDGWSYEGTGDADIVTLLTWGTTQRCTWRWLRSRLVEAHGILWPQLATPSPAFLAVRL